MNFKKNPVIVLFLVSALFCSKCYAMQIDYFDTDVGAAINELAVKLLSFAGGIALLFLVGGGVYYISSIGDVEKGKKAKNMVTYAVIGLSIIMLSYAILVAIDKIATK